MHLSNKRDDSPKKNSNTKRICSKLQSPPRYSSKSKSGATSGSSASKSKPSNKLVTCPSLPLSTIRSKRPHSIAPSTPSSKSKSKYKTRYDKFVARKKSREQEEKRLEDEDEFNERQERLAALKGIIPVANSSPIVRNKLTDGLQKIHEKRSVYDKRPRPFNIMAKIINIIAAHDRQCERLEMMKLREARRQQKLRLWDKPPECEELNPKRNQKCCQPKISLNKITAPPPSPKCQKQEYPKKIRTLKSAKKIHKSRSEIFQLEKDIEDDTLIKKASENLFCKPPEESPKPVESPFLDMGIKKGEKLDEELTVASIGFEFLKTLQDEIEKINNNIKELESQKEQSSKSRDRFSKGYDELFDASSSSDSLLNDLTLFQINQRLNSSRKIKSD